MSLNPASGRAFRVGGARDQKVTRAGGPAGLAAVPSDFTEQATEPLVPSSAALQGVRSESPGPTR
eukprot:767988-Hanusia_phi.AAC.1